MKQLGSTYGIDTDWASPIPNSDIIVWVRSADTEGAAAKSRMSRLIFGIGREAESKVVVRARIVGTVRNSHVSMLAEVTQCTQRYLSDRFP